MMRKLTLGIGKTNLTEQIPTENLTGAMIDYEIGACNLQRGLKETRCLPIRLKAICPFHTPPPQKKEKKRKKKKGERKRRAVNFCRVLVSPIFHFSPCPEKPIEEKSDFKLEIINEKIDNYFDLQYFGIL